MPETTDVPATTGVPDETGVQDMTSALSPQESDALLSRLRLIEDQPLDQRAAAFAQVHDQLQATLEGGNPTRFHD